MGERVTCSGGFPFHSLKVLESAPIRFSNGDHRDFRLHCLRRHRYHHHRQRHRYRHRHRHRHSFC